MRGIIKCEETKKCISDTVKLLQELLGIHAKIHLFNLSSYPQKYQNIDLITI